MGAQERAFQVLSLERAKTELSAEVKAIDAQLKNEPNNAQLWMQRGLELSKQRLMREAVEAFSNALAIEPFSGILYRHRGHRHLSCWQFAQSVADFEMAARMIPENWDVWYHLALAHYLSGNYEKAANAYSECYKLTAKDDLELLCAVTDWSWRTLQRLGKKEEAKQLVAKLPADFDVEIEPSGYSRACAMYQGRIKPEDLMDGRMNGDGPQGVTMGYALANYYYINGDMQKSNDVINQVLTVGDDAWWSGFGYLASMVDKYNRENN